MGTKENDQKAACTDNTRAGYHWKGGGRMDEQDGRVSDGGEVVQVSVEAHRLAKSSP